MATLRGTSDVSGVSGDDERESMVVVDIGDGRHKQATRRAAQTQTPATPPDTDPRDTTYMIFSHPLFPGFVLTMKRGAERQLTKDNDDDEDIEVRAGRIPSIPRSRRQGDTRPSGPSKGRRVCPSQETVCPSDTIVHTT